MLTSIYKDKILLSIAVGCLCVANTTLSSQVVFKPFKVVIYIFILSNLKIQVFTLGHFLHRNRLQKTEIGYKKKHYRISV